MVSSRWVWSHNYVRNGFSDARFGVKPKSLLLRGFAFGFQVAQSRDFTHFRIGGFFYLIFFIISSDKTEVFSYRVRKSKFILKIMNRDYKVLTK